MEAIPCVHCGSFFKARNREQNYCSEPACQRARKAVWQRYKMKNDSEYRTQQRLSHQKWLRNNPDYWKRYRQRHPDKALRNRALQHIRNRRQRQKGSTVIAKMDVRKSRDFDLIGHFYLVPMIAKMDVSEVNIYTVSKGCARLQRWTSGQRRAADGTVLEKSITIKGGPS